MSAEIDSIVNAVQDAGSAMANVEFIAFLRESIAGTGLPETTINRHTGEPIYVVHRDDHIDIERRRDVPELLVTIMVHPGDDVDMVVKTLLAVLLCLR
jgi:hypothetical protein